MGGNGSMCQEIAQAFQANVGVWKDQADNAKSKFSLKTRQGQSIGKQNTIGLDKIIKKYRTTQSKPECQPESSTHYQH